MTIYIALISATLLMFLTAPAYANDSSRNKEIQERFAQCDANRDGRLTLNEAKGCMPRVFDNFSKIDQQNKGFVTLTDIESMASR